MSIRIDSFQLKIDGAQRNNVLSRYRDTDGKTYLFCLQNGNFPLNKDRNYIMEKDIIKKVAKSFPDSEIFFSTDTDYGAGAYLYKNGELKKLKMEWKEE